jgi:4'-phosphopantetheinyl transferase
MQGDLLMPVWEGQAKALLLEPDDVHIWRADLHRIDQEKEMDFALPERELLAAADLKRIIDRKRYIASRYMLRSLLGRYTGRNPAELEFTTNSYNKPFLKDSELQFNLTHSGNIIIIVIGYIKELGIDVEHIEPTIQIFPVIKKVFSPIEILELMANKQAQLLREFYVSWTKKEAYVKAKGKGLSIPLKSFAVASGRDATLRYSRLYAHDRDTFVFTTFIPAKDFVATAAVSSSYPVFSFYEMVLPSFCLS